MKFHGLDWQSNPNVTIQQSTKMDFQSKSNPKKKDWIFGFFFKSTIQSYQPLTIGTTPESKIGQLVEQGGAFILRENYLG